MYATLLLVCRVSASWYFTILWLCLCLCLGHCTALLSRSKPVDNVPSSRLLTHPFFSSPSSPLSLYLPLFPLSLSLSLWLAPCLWLVSLKMIDGQLIELCRYVNNQLHCGFIRWFDDDDNGKFFSQFEFDSNSLANWVNLSQLIYFLNSNVIFAFIC